MRLLLLPLDSLEFRFSVAILETDQDHMQALM